jgi:hypothetical protein
LANGNIKKDVERTIVSGPLDNGKMMYFYLGPN